MKKILLALGLCLLPSLAFAQCSGVFTAGNVCGALITGAPKQIPLTSFPPFASANANTVFAGPTSGPAAAPAFRALIGTDLPLPAIATTGAVFSKAATPSNWLRSLGTDGAFTISQPAFTDISGALPLSQMATIANSTILGNVSGGAAVPFALTATQSTTLCNTFTTSLKGCVPASGGGTANFLRADGTFAPPAAAGAPSQYILSRITGAWVCTAANGTIVSTGATTTSGLQECINAAQTDGANFKAYCDQSNPIIATTQVTFGPSFGLYYELEGCFFQTSSFIQIDTVGPGAHIRWGGGLIQCTAVTASRCVYFFPSTINGLGVYGISQSFIDLPWIYISGCVAGGATGAAVELNSNFGAGITTVSAIYGNKIQIAGITGFNGTHNCMNYGLYTINPTNIYGAIGQNYFYVGYINAFYQIGIVNGTGAVTIATQSLATNQWDIGSIGSGQDPTDLHNPSNGVLTYGFYDRWNINISENNGTLGTGLFFAGATAQGNWFISNQLDGTTPLNDGGTGVTNKGFYNATLHNIP